ncbi:MULTISPECIES: hypothetical protein [unclassified Veillonella]|uniref:hypothetical protein n=1 Tax=unclassified Veillonella TaxID=2630086 RepID=UPI00021A1AAF|nr:MULTISPECIES: hypothetical protein [unclassified Veillonella]EGS37226.1 hypothetical protein HMPREF9200_1031 [Veillonella sp. oral taxon 780 str. F0422]
MKLWKQMGLAVIVTSLMMGYGQVSAQVHDTTYEVVGSSASMPYGIAGSSASISDEIAGTSDLMSDEEVGVPSSTILDAEKKRQTGDEIIAEFDAMLEQNPLTDLRQTVGSKITVKQLSSSKLAEVGKGYVYANLGKVSTTVGVVKDYTGLKNMKEGLKLGHYMDVYELQGADQYGLNTAWVLVFPLPKELLMNAQSSLSYGKEGLSSAEMDRITRDANDLLNHFNIHIAEDRDIDYSQNKRPAKIRLRNVEPLHTLTDTKYGTMTTAGNMTYDITGIQYPGYLRLALVGTPEYLTTIVMGTTEVEGTFFKPYFLQMLQHIK